MLCFRDGADRAKAVSERSEFAVAQPHHENNGQPREKNLQCGRAKSATISLISPFETVY